MGVYKPDNETLICSNHYQSETFINDPINKSNIRESDSKYRYERVKALLSKREKWTPTDAAEVLRDQHANNGDTLGMGNPRAINQLIAHHSVVIQPESKLFYVSTQDYQLGKYVAYDLKKVFESGKVEHVESIEADPFVSSRAYYSFKD